MVTTRIKKALTLIPASISEAATFLMHIGEKQREINRIKREAKKKITEINSEMEKSLVCLVKERDTYFTSLFAFASPRKAELTKKNRSQKTVYGTFGWRWTTPYVELAEGKTDEEIVAILKKKGLTAYIRVVEELDREALLRDRPTVPCVSYSNRDEFFAKPKLSKNDGKAEELIKTETIDV